MEEGKKENPPCDISYGLKLRTQDPIAESRSGTSYCRGQPGQLAFFSYCIPCRWARWDGRRGRNDGLTPLVFSSLAT